MRIFFSLFIIFNFAHNSFSQKADSLKVDSTDTFIQFDKNVLFAEENIIFINYTGIKDVFRYSFPIIAFDFLEPGRPEFVGLNNLFPHQTIINYKNNKLNDPVYGGYNLRFLSLDQLKKITNRPVAGAYTLADLNLESINEDYDQPYTRMKYLEGDFTYFDLDLLFQRPLSENLSLKLAGFNKGYSSGVHILRPEKGYNYGGEIIYSLDTLNHFSFGAGLNRDDNAVRNLLTNQRSRYYEDQDYLYLTWKYAKDKKNPLIHSGLKVNNTVRKIKTDDYTLRESIDRYDFFAFRNFNFKRLNYGLYTNYRQNYIRGNSFLKDYRVHVLTLNNHFSINAGKFNTLMKAELEYDSEFGSTISGVVHFNYYAEKSKWGSGVKYKQRAPNLQERFYDFAGYKGDKNLDSESFFNIFAENQYYLFNFWDISSEAGYSSLKNEILLSDSSFFNNSVNRDWFYALLQSRLGFWKFSLSGGIRYLNSDYNSLAPWQTFAKLHYSDNWFNAIGIDLIAFMSWSDDYNTLIYMPLLQRFSMDNTISPAFARYAFKAVATVKDAQLFFELENPLSEDITFINGYFDQFRQVRFGINWVFYN